MKQQHLPRAGDTIAYLNTLSAAGSSGEVLFQSGGRTAKVYLHRGLVVWAFAGGQEESFQSILIKEHSFSREALLNGIRRVRSEGKRNLSEILLALGLEDEELRQKMVERHTRAALDALLRWEDCSAKFNAFENGGTEPVRGLRLSELLNFDLPPELKKPQHQKPGPKEVPTSPPKHRYKSELESVPAENIGELLERFRTEVPGFIAAVLVDGSTGMPISWVSDAEGLDAEVIGAFYSDISARANDALRQVGGGPDAPSRLEELLITSNRDIAILKTIKGAEHLLYLLLEREANPAMARVAIRRHLPELEKFLT